MHDISKMSYRIGLLSILYWRYLPGMPEMVCIPPWDPHPAVTYNEPHSPRRVRHSIGSQWLLFKYCNTVITGVWVITGTSPLTSPTLLSYSTDYQLQIFWLNVYINSRDVNQKPSIHKAWSLITFFTLLAILHHTILYT